VHTLPFCIIICLPYIEMMQRMKAKYQFLVDQAQLNVSQMNCFKQANTTESIESKLEVVIQELFLYRIIQPVL
jgi:hypothetical protein